MSFHLGGELFGDAFSTSELREVFDQEGYVAAFQEVEAALARAEARAGLIPEEAAKVITEKANPSYVDNGQLATKIDEIDLFTMAIIETWKDAFQDAGEYIHWGATSQDISDTTVVLQLRAAHDVFLRDITAIRDELAPLAETHRDTPMIGRTHHVHATPITFGLKVASWIDELDRHRTRLQRLEEHVFVLEFFGATGTLASLGEEGREVQQYLAEELDLEVPATSWFAARDRFAEYLQTLASIATTLERIAKQILLLNRPEIGELGEPVPEGAVGSSTMPHKRNPVLSERTVALARLVRAQSNVMTEAMAGYGERDFGAWYSEFAVIPEGCLYLGRQLANIRQAIEGLTVNPERMAKNLDIHGSLVASEGVMMELAEYVGRQTAHDIVYDAAMTAMTSDQSFSECLRADSRITNHLSEGKLDELTDHRSYVGLAPQFVDEVLDQLSY